jgi:hypothetical protein
MKGCANFLTSTDACIFFDRGGVASRAFQFASKSVVPNVNTSYTSNIDCIGAQIRIEVHNCNTTERVNQQDEGVVASTSHANCLLHA